MLRSIVLGNSYFPTEVRVLAEFRVSHLEIRHFRLQWNDISYWQTRKYDFPSPMERSISPPRFLAECCKRRLNQGSFVSAVCLVVCFLWFVLCLCAYFCDLYWVFPYCLFVSDSQGIGCEDRLRNDLHCVRWGIKLYSTQSISYHIVILKWQNYHLKVGTDKPQLKVKMQSVSDDEKTSWKATFWAGGERCIQTGKMLYLPAGHNLASGRGFSTSHRLTASFSFTRQTL